jgi:HD-GYP domain-containing protein (c-di-GMP phosphodiesterase class II)
MPLDQIKVDIDNLTTGMYVSRLDRPWIDTPFPLQGYYIREIGDISALRQYCSYVYIDIRRGKSPVDPEFLQTLDNSTQVKKVTQSSPGKKSAGTAGTIRAKKLKTRKGIYKQTTSAKQEVKNALKMKRLADLALSYIDMALRNNEQLPIAETRKVVSVMVRDIIRNPDAFIWLNKIREKDTALYGHTVRTTIWAVSLGRHMGISTEALNNLAMGIMISDVGKSRLPDYLLKKDKMDYSDDELTLYQSHVGKALEIIKQSDMLDKQILGVVANMHERHDGSGYPRGLTGNQIPYLAKIAGIASAYDELTFPRATEFGLSPSDAISRLYKMINRQFQQDLVEEFIQAIGIYPAGTLVELSTGETAMVLEQNPERKLRPSVILLLDEERKPYKKYRTLDMMKIDSRHGVQLDILYSLPIGSYGADPAAIYTSTFTTRWPFSIAS